MAATRRVATCILAAADTTVAKALKDSIDGVTALTGNASFGSRLKSLSILSGPTTAPGGTYVVAVLMVDPSTAETVIDEVTLVNTANTIAYDEKIWPTRILPPGCSLKAAMRTTLAAGATIHVSVVAEDLTQ